jgi:phospholipid/cholesterol/gamma-HCH transport system permease protein
MRPELSFAYPADAVLLISISGEWKRDQVLPSADEVRDAIQSESRIRQVTFDAGNLTGWDSSLLIFLIKVMALCSAGGITVDKQGLPQGAQRLLSLASNAPEWAGGAGKEAARSSLLEQLGSAAVSFRQSFLEILSFIGETCVAFGRFFIGRARFRKTDLFLIMQECGAQALPIVSLISVLVGLILAFIGAIQLKIFGAQIYVASLVGIGMVRALAAVMTGIIMAGRTGASFAAQLGTMQVNEEIDALKTLGISPVEFLVLPRLLALSFMMPLLSLYADLMGILGGLFVGVTMLDLNVMEYFNKTQETVHLNDVWVGLFTATVFGVLVSLASCLRGMQCGRSASAVGEATTSAVVTSIVGIVVSTAAITIICNVLNM